ncbi:hypothetical protein Bbelb_101080 [Branchiostoma belcheri]|nr:hypothetical protein Bbelb_101080 [Branchiostoma belcheri]
MTAGPSAKRPRRGRVQREEQVHGEKTSAGDLFLRISQNLKDDQVNDLRNYLSGEKLLPERDLQHMDPQQMCIKLEQRRKLWEGDPTLLERLMRMIGREDFADEVRTIAAEETEGCKVSLSQGRYRWRHDRVLRVLAAVLEEERTRKRQQVRKGPQFIGFVKEGEVKKGVRRKTEEGGILTEANDWVLQVDLDRKLTFPEESTAPRVQQEWFLLRTIMDAAGINQAFETHNRMILNAVSTMMDEKLGTLKRANEEMVEKQVNELKRMKKAEAPKIKKKAYQDQYDFSQKVKEKLEQAKAEVEAGKNDRALETLTEGLDITPRPLLQVLETRNSPALVSPADRKGTGGTGVQSSAPTGNSRIQATDVYNHGFWEDAAELKDLHLKELAGKLPAVAVASRAPGTVEQYRTAFNKWREFASRYTEVVAFPALPLHVALYLMELIQSSSSFSTVEKAAFGIRWAHLQAGLTSPTEEAVVKNVLNAAKRLLGKPVVKKEVITPDILAKIVQKAGGASAAANAGIPERLFKRHGRWMSDKAKDGYVKDKLQERLAVSMALGI